jgi:hypothetical protein
MRRWGAAGSPMSVAAAPREEHAAAVPRLLVGHVDPAVRSRHVALLLHDEGGRLTEPFGARSRVSFWVKGVVSRAAVHTTASHGWGSSALAGADVRVRGGAAAGADGA